MTMFIFFQCCCSILVVLIMISFMRQDQSGSVKFIYPRVSLRSDASEALRKNLLPPLAIMFLITVETSNSVTDLFRQIVIGVAVGLIVDIIKPST